MRKSSLYSKLRLTAYFNLPGAGAAYADFRIGRDQGPAVTSGGFARFDRLDLRM